MAPKRYCHNLPDCNTDQDDLNVESVGKILDGFEANVFDSNKEKVKILQDHHRTFENTTAIPAEGSPEAKFAKKCKARSEARYKWRNGIIKSMRLESGDC